MPLATLGATTVTPAQRPCEPANCLETAVTRCIPGVWGVLASNCCGLITRTLCSIAASCLSLLTCCLLLYLCFAQATGTGQRQLLAGCPAPVAALCGGLDVLIHAKEIGGIVLALDGHQALVVVSIGGFDALLTLLFHHEIHIRAACRIRVYILPVLPGPVPSARCSTRLPRTYSCCGDAQGKAVPEARSRRQRTRSGHRAPA